MRKQAIIGEALDNYVDLQAKHPAATMGVGLAAGLVPGVGTAMQLPNIAHSIRHGRPWDALGQTGQAALGLVPGLSMLNQIVLPTAAGLGGNYMQQRADAAKAASYGGRLMSQQMTKAALPFLAPLAAAAVKAGPALLAAGKAALPAAKAIGGAAAQGAAMTGGSAAAQHIADKVTAPSEPKQAFAQRLKAAQATVNPNAQENLMKKSRYELVKSAVAKLAADPTETGKIGVTPEELEALKATAAGDKLHEATSGGALGGAGMQALTGGGIGGLAGLGVGAAAGKPGMGAAMGGLGGLGGTAGYHGGNLLSLLLKSKGIDAPYMTQGLRGAGAGLGAGAGAGLGYAMTRDKEGSYQPRLLLSSLTNAARAGGQRMLPGPFPTAVR